MLRAMLFFSVLRPPSVSRCLVWSALIALWTVGCGRAGLGARSDAGAKDSAVADIRTDVSDTPSTIAEDTRLADAADRDLVVDAFLSDGPGGEARAAVGDGRDVDSDSRAPADGASCTPGHFTLGGWPIPPVPDFATAIAVGDLNGDGHADLVVASYNLNAVAILLGRGNGLFTAGANLATGLGPASVVIAEVSGDGKADLVVSNEKADTVTVLIGAGDGSFAGKDDYPTAKGPGPIAVGDFTGDGRPDIAVGAGWTSHTLTILQNRGGGAFSKLKEYPIDAEKLSLAAGDLDGDGRADLALAAGSESPLNGGSGAEVGIVTRLGNSIVMGDLDGDGRLDLAWSTGKTITVTLNQGSGVFTPAVEYAAGPVVACPSYALNIGDVNADGRPDLVALNEDCRNVTVLLNRGDGRFADPQRIDVDGYPRPLALGDLNGDNRADLVLITDQHYLTILLARPDGSFTPHWLPADDTIEYRTGAIDDLDGDGWLDLVRVEDGNIVAVWLGQPDGTLAVRTQIKATGSMQLPGTLDVDGDGILDVTFWDMGYGKRSDLRVMRGLGHGDFAQPVTTALGERSMESAAFGDLDNDGDADLVLAFFAAGSVSVLLNQGDGRFAEERTYPAGAGKSFHVAIGDLNADGKLDMVQVSVVGKTVRLLSGRGDGTFDDGMAIDFTGSPEYPFTADINGDGITDLIVTGSYPRSVGVLLGRKGSPGAVQQTAIDFRATNLLGIADMDKDGRSDLVFRSDTMLFVLLGAGDGSFLGTLAYDRLHGSPKALADFDQNGRVDVGVARTEAQALRWHVYRNDQCR